MEDKNSSRRWNQGFDTPFFIVLLALMVWAPIPLGSNRPWAWSILEVTALSTLGVWCLHQVAWPTPLPPSVRSARWPLLFLGLWLAYTLLQAIPLPVSLVAQVSPAASELYRYSLGQRMGETIPLSIDPRATLEQTLQGASYAAIFFLTLVLVTSRSRLRVVMTVVMFMGLAEAVYGLFNTLSGAEMIGWMKKEAYEGYVTGTYVNRNHFAGLMEIVIPLSIGLLIAQKTVFHYRPTWGKWFAGLATAALEPRGRLALYIIILFAALFLSGSRGGAASLMVAVTAVLAFAGGSGESEGRGGERRLIPAVLALALAAGVWLGLGALPDRYAGALDPAKDRAEIWRMTAGIIGDYPVTGSGAGSFATLFPLYKDDRVYAYYDHAHNEYYELLAEQGVIGGLLAAGMVLTALWSLLRGIRNRRSRLARGGLFASVAAIVALLLHGFVDFNFHIPANAALWFMMFGIGFSALHIAGGGVRKRSFSQEDETSPGAGGV